MQILTVGQSDHAQDAGETAAGGGAQPSGQDLRATMQRKGEPCGVSVTPRKLSPRFIDVPFWRSMVLLCLLRSLLGPGRGAQLDTNEKLGCRGP